MRIDRLEVQNFKKYEKQTLDLHPQFTLLAGVNGSGKTTLLDAIAVAAGVWLVEPPDSTLKNSGRNIAAQEIRLVAEANGDRTQFREMRPVRVTATGSIAGSSTVSWTRQIRSNGVRTSNAEAKDALTLVRDVFRRDAEGERSLCPVLGYYGAGRAWLPSNARIPKAEGKGVARRWAAFYDCFSERIRFSALQAWFEREAIERGNRGGSWRAGFEAVRSAVLECVPDSRDIWFDSDRDQIVLEMDGDIQPFENLSAGQRMVAALAADLAIKAVTQNAFLPAEEVLQQTPGLVLIDELDVHLHPKWQRRVGGDLKRTFPAIQFVCTSHSAQVLGELTPEEIRLLEEDRVSVPVRSFGIDSSRILEELMESPPRNKDVDEQLSRLSEVIDREDLVRARELLGKLEMVLGSDDPEINRLRTLITFLEPVS